MLKIVLDTNVLVSALWSEQGNPLEILEKFFQDEFLLYYCDEIMEEYDEVLHRTKLGFSKAKVSALLEEILVKGISSRATVSNISFIDESDRVFFDLAKENGAFLITGNTKHYPNEPFILTPQQFLAFFLGLSS